MSTSLVSNDFNIKTWDCRTGKELKTLKGHQANINTLCVGNEYTLTGSSDGQAKLWSKEGHLITTLKGPTTRINDSSLVQTQSQT